MKKYETLLGIAKKVCDGVMEYYDAKNETEASKLYMLVWEQVYLLAQLVAGSIRYAAKPLYLWIQRFVSIQEKLWILLTVCMNRYTRQLKHS